MNEYTIITIFCHLDDLAKSMKLKEPCEKMTASEVALVGIIASIWFGGNLSSASLFLRKTYIQNMLSISRLVRRLHNIPEKFWRVLIKQLAGEDTEYVVDSFPIASCHPVRSFVSKLFSGEEFKGYNASKKQWFFGLKVHVVAARGKQIVDFVISPACEHDLTGLKVMNPNLPKGSYLFGDKAYTDYGYEEKLASQGINLVAERKKNSKRPHPEKINSKRQRVRKRIETLFSDILKMFPRFLKAVTEAGFELKITMFLVAQSLISAIKTS